MKILHVITGIQKAAGTSVFCVELSNYLFKKGCSVEIATKNLTRNDNYWPISGVILSEIKTIFASKHSWDLIHIHGLWEPILHKVVIFAKKRKLPIVWSPHGGLTPWAFAHKKWKKMLVWYFYQHHDLNEAVLIHTTSSMETNYIRKMGFLNKIVEAPLGTFVPPVLSEKNSNIKFIVFVGRIYPVKGLDLLLNAWSIVKNRIKNYNWHLVLIGPDQAGYMKKLECLADKLKLTISHGSVLNERMGDIIFTGALYGDQKDSIVRDSQFAVLPSYTENFGGVVIDALAQGIPVIASEATPWNILNTYKCGETFELKSSSLACTLFKFMNLSDVERNEMGERGRNLVKSKFSWNEIGDKLKESYEKVLNI